MQAWEPVYLETQRRGLLQAKIDAAYEILSQCTLCPRNCLVDRHHGELGLCRTGDKPVVSSYGPHFGEEDPLVGSQGSGTIFFTHCNLYLYFCQNYEISHGGEGEEVSVEDLAAMMLALQKRGCHNINFVTPSHQVYQDPGIARAIAGGLNVPPGFTTPVAMMPWRLCGSWTGGRCYMPDFKFWGPQVAKDFCQAEDYPEIARQAVGDAPPGWGPGDGRSRSGPARPVGAAFSASRWSGRHSGNHGVLDKEISPHTYVNVMGQYRPCGRAGEHPSLGKFLTGPEHEEAQRLAREAGLTRLDRREKLFRWL